MLGASCGGPCHDGDMVGGEVLAGTSASTATARIRARERRGAHGGSAGVLSGSGEALESTERRWGSTAAGGEEGDGDGSTGRSGLRGSAESFRARRRSSCACRRDEGETVAAAMASGGDGSVQAR